MSPATCRPTATPASSVEVELTRRRAEDPAGGGTPVATRARRARRRTAKWFPSRSTSSQAKPARSCISFASKPPADDGNPRDNQREAEVDVVDRKTRVLLFASGPMRDYQYLAQPVVSRHDDDGRRAAANRPARHLAGSERDPGPISQHGRGAVPIRLHRGVRSGLDGARCRRRSSCSRNGFPRKPAE